MMPAAKANGTLMARGGFGHDRYLTFSQVELGGLEPPTPCLQNTCRLSDTVAHLGLWPRRVGQDRFVSDPVGSALVVSSSRAGHRPQGWRSRTQAGPRSAGLRAAVSSQAWTSIKPSAGFTAGGRAKLDSGCRG